MNRRKLISLVLSALLTVFVFASCFSANLKNISLSGIASADTGSAAGRTVILMIGSPTMFVNGVGQEIDPGYNTAPVIASGRTCLPIRALIGDAGTVNWDATQRKTTIILGSTTVILTIGSPVATVNGVAKTMDLAPFISSTGRTMLPLRFIVENLNMKVDWYAAARTVVVNMDSATPTITITQPASGVSWQAGSSRTISWNYSNLTGTVSIDLLEGSSTASITSSASVGSGGYGSYSWTPSSNLAAASDYRIRVKSNSNATVSSTSNYFTVTNSSDSITVTTPTSSTSWDVGSTHPIYWNYSGLDSAGTVDIELYKGSTDVENIVSGRDIGSGGSGSYSWTPGSDLTEATNYRIRITSNDDSSIYDYSDYFSIGGSSDSITVTTPTSSTSWDVGSTHPIYWNYSGLDSAGTVDIELYKGSTDVENIVSGRDIGSGGSGSYSWTPGSDLTEATNYRIRITSNDDSSIYDYSDYFSIGSSSDSSDSITVTTPSSSTAWKVGTAYTIKWNYSNLDSAGTVDIELYKGSTDVENIVSGRDIGSGGSGSYSWTPGSDLTAATNYRIRITSNDDSSIYDYSDYFTITKSAPKISITTPTSTTTWKRGSTYTIKWTYSNLDSAGTVDIELYQGSTYIDTIVNNRDIGSGGSGSYSWRVDSGLDAATNYKIKISSDDVATCTATSSYFKIT